MGTGSLCQCLVEMDRNHLGLTIVRVDRCGLIRHDDFRRIKPDNIDAIRSDIACNYILFHQIHQCRVVV